MRNKIISRLLFLVTFLTVLYSCRNDHFPEQVETYSNSSKFQLTSQRISLNQSKHKERLLPELEKAEAEFKAKTTSNTFGKVVNYGNGVSINTDDVIYIENGPNYHTYTFRITRDNAPANAPVENLVLTPLSDGSYRELLVTYTLTPQEKQLLENGSFVDLTGKTASQELVQGTYGAGIMGKTTTTQCHWETYTYDVPCPCEGHTVGQECTCPKGKPMQYVLTWNVCEEVEDTSPTGGNTDTGNTGGGGTGTATPPCEDPVSTEPQDPSSTLGTEDGCNTGTPTLPNLGELPKNPCEKTKNMLARPNVQQRIDTIKAQALKTLSNIKAGEIGFREKNDGTVVPADVNASHKVVYNDVTGSRGGYHNHTATGTHMFSPPDIADTLFGFAAAQSVQDGVGNAYFGMIAAEWCNTCPNNVQYIHYVISFAGTGTELGGYVYTPAQMKQFENDYRQIAGDLADTSLNGTTYIKNNAGDLNEKGLEKLFIETLKIMNLSGKVNLQRIEPNGTVYNITEDSNGMPVGTPCP